MSDPFTVLIADDHALSLAGLAQALDATAGLRVVACVTCGVDAVAQARALRPDLAVLDYAMPDATGVAVMADLRRWAPGTRVAILTGTEAAPALARMAEAGPDGLFLKATAPDAICAGLLAVAGGRRVIDPAAQAGAGAAPSLSPREAQVLACIAAGMTNPAVAGQLGISVKTVESHRAALMRKMGVHSTASLLIRAVRDGFVRV